MPLSPAFKVHALNGKAGMLDLISELLWSLGVPHGYLHFIHQSLNKPSLGHKWASLVPLLSSLGILSRVPRRHSPRTIDSCNKMPPNYQPTSSHR